MHTFYLFILIFSLIVFLELSPVSYELLNQVLHLYFICLEWIIVYLDEV